MATIASRCAMMQNAFPATTLSLQGKFFVVEDNNGEPMIFSVDSRGKLCLVVKGVNGHNELINLSTSFGLDEKAEVTALAVTQSRQNLLHLTFAASRADGYHSLHVVRPMPSEREAWLDPEALKRGLYSGQLGDVTVSDILMGNGNDRPDEAYPQLYLTLKLADKSTEDIWSVTVSNETASFAREPLFQMTCNPGEIISKCIGNIGNRNPDYKASYRGLFVLYKEASASADLQLRFVGLDFDRETPTLQSFEQPVPDGARVISSFDNPEGWTDLVVYSDTLLWRTAVECYIKADRPYRAPTRYGGEDREVQMLPHRPLAKQMAIAQAGDRLSIWTLDTNSLLSWQEFEIYGKETRKPPKALCPPLPLLEQRHGSDRFAAVCNSRLGQKVFIADQAGTRLKMLHQSVETRMWQAPVDVMLPVSDEVREYLSHTVTINAEDASKQPMAQQELLLTSSTGTEMIVNGVSVLGSPSGVKVKTDERGSLTVVIPANGLAAPILSVKDVPGAAVAVFGGRETTIDPMQKVWDELAKVQSVDDLRALTLPDGTSFIRDGLSKADQENAVKSIKDLLLARQSIASGLRKADTSRPSDPRWGAWHWVKDAAEEAVECFVEQVGQAWKFVVKIAGQAWEFLIENYPQVAAALQKILEMVGKGWEAIREYFEELFPWRDIVAVKNALVNMTTAGIIMGSDVFATLESKADERFRELRQKVLDLKGKPLPKELADIKFSNAPPTPNGMSDKGLDSFVRSPQMQYGVYHLSHSGGVEEKSGVLPPRSQGETSFDRLTKRLSGIFDSLTQLALRFGVNIADLLSNPSFDLETLIQKVGLDLVYDALGVIQKTITAILGSLSDVLLELANALNADIKIPVIGPLYKSLTGSARFSALDAVCLLLAIPATIAYKNYVGPLPKEDADYQELVKLDAVQGNLDLQMRQLSTAVSTATSQVNSDPASVAPPTSTKAAGLGLGSMNVKSASMSVQSASMFSDAKTLVGLAASGSSRETKGPVDRKVQQLASAWWSQAGKIGVKIFQALIPLGMLVYTCGYKLPKAMAAGANAGQGQAAEQIAQAPSPLKIALKYVMISLKFVAWIGHGMSICWTKVKEIKDWDKDFMPVVIKAADDAVFGWKCVLWGFGYIPIVGSLLHEYIGTCAGGAVAIVQTLGLVAMHIDVYVISKASYPWYRCPEEYINALAKVAVAAATLTMGQDPWTLGFAFGLTGAGKSWTYIRVVQEIRSMKTPDAVAIDATV
ncbi:hypothetical protein NLU13_8173 [Sarocladium strictum]|uniref:Uncharacterized protein n=1 Tax=Sarocladium strictum TaxID=5046 RepID=A0AA39GCK8_SARSR|nr:hypothetical protein NLU13_8173 [Sarocladium strictum]